MRKYLFIIGLMFLGTILYAQEQPRDIKRYDYKDADMYDGATYSVLKLTDCVTNGNEYKLRVTYSYEKNHIEHNVVLFFSDGVVAEIIKTFNYLINTQFEPVNKGDESFIVCEVGEGAYFKYKLNTRHIDLMVRVAVNNLEETQTLAGIDKTEIEEFRSLLNRIGNAFAEKGRNLEDAVISNNNIEPLF